MKKEIIADVLMIVAFVLVMAVAPVIWGLYSLGAGIAPMFLCAMTMIAGAAACSEKAFDMTESEEEETKKEERL